MSSKYQPSRLALAVGSALAVSSTQAATITVTTLDDPGEVSNCSLRSAIESVNTQSAVDACTAGDGIDDTIVFDGGLNGAIGLTEGQLEVAADVHISGPGAENVTVDAGGYSRGFSVSGANVTIAGLTVTGGDANYAGGVYVIDNADVVLSDCVITGNSASSSGGAVEVFYGNLEVENCEISGNTGSYGGGIAVTAGTALVSESTVTGNQAYEIGGGLWVNGSYTEGPLALAKRRPGRRSRGYEGPVLNALTIADSTVTGNQSYQGGGVAAGRSNYSDLSNALLDWKDAEARAELLSRLAPPEGADITGIGGPADPNLIILDSTVSGNVADFGGGVMAASNSGGQGPNSVQGDGYGVTSSILVEGSTIGENLSYLGGGLATKYSSSYLLETGVVDNTAYAYGGGIANLGSPKYGAPPENILVQSQVSGNQVLGAPGNRGGPFGGAGVGGGIFNAIALAYLADTGVAGNTASFGGGMANFSGLSYSYLSTFDGNQGGGIFSIYGSTSVVFGARVQENSGPWGGGMDCLDSSCAIMYSSITGNEGGLVGGINAGLYDMNQSPKGTQRGGPNYGVEIHSSTLSGNSGGVAGGVFSPGYTNLKYSTVADNHQDSSLIGDQQPSWDGDGGGVVAGYESSVVHSIIADNSAESGPNDLYVAEDFSPSDDVIMDWSLVRDSTGFTPVGGDNIFDEDPLLGPLDFHGGSHSLAHSLLSGSPALDAGDPDIADPPAYDQRGPGFDRVFNDRIDFGAFEGQGEPAIGLSVTDIDFGDVLIGADAAADVTIESAGTAPLEIGQIEIVGLPAEFEIFDDNCSNVMLDPAEDCTFSVRFGPAARQIHSEIASIPSNAPDTPAEVELTGRGVAPELTVAPDPLDFGNVEIGATSGVELVELSNSGDAVLNVDSVDPAAVPFAANGGSCALPGTLAPGESCTLGFDFSPNAEGLAMQDIAVASDSFGGAEGFTLRGTGFDTTPAISLSATSIDFDDVLVGGDDAAALIIESVGAGPLTIGQIEFGPTTLGLPAEFEIFDDLCSNAVLAPSEQCTLGVRFEPPARGDFGASLSIPSDAPDSPAEVTLLGAGVAPELTIDPVLLDFGTVEVGSTGPDGSVELSNTGDAVLNLTDASTPAAPFASAGGTCAIPGSLGIGESCTLEYTFSPTETGAASQTINVGSDSLGGDDAFALQGNGTSEPPPPAVAIPVMGRLTALLLGGGLMLFGMLGLRRRFN